MTRKEFDRKQRAFDKAHPANCVHCGMLVAIVPSKNGVDVKVDLDEESNPLLAAHKCPMAGFKKKIKESGTQQERT